MRSEQSFTGGARRRQLIEVSIDTLAELGYARSSIAAIAERAGVSKGVVSYHVTDKAELMRTVVTHVLAEAEAAMTPRITAAGSYAEALHAYIDANLAYLGSHPRAAAALVEVLANARDVDGLPELWESAHARAVAGLEQLFEGGRAAGEFGDVPADVLAMALRATIDAAAAQLRSESRAGDDASASEESARRIQLLFDRATQPHGREES